MPPRSPEEAPSGHRRADQVAALGEWLEAHERTALPHLQQHLAGHFVGHDFVERPLLMATMTPLSVATISSVAPD